MHQATTEIILYALRSEIKRLNNLVDRMLSRGEHKIHVNRIKQKVDGLYKAINIINEL